tara:strand:+ start:53 stop:535 length:483 start_codon:yes stop_codon:yes gene_type:complete
MQTKEERAAYKKQYYENNKEKLLADTKQYYENNREKLLADKKQYYENNKTGINIYGKEYYKNNKKDLRAKQKEKRDKRNLMLFKHKGSECAHCKLSEPDHSEIYDYHHLDPTTKMYSISIILEGPIERLIAEVDKCLLLCSNCHRKEHARLHKEKQDEAL